MSKRAWATALGFAVLVAVYTGIRLPSRWVVTLQALSITDGIHRRFVVGTLLRPLALATGQSYWLYVAFTFAVLIALFVLIVRAALRAEPARGMIVIGWLFVMGGFAWNEAGNLDQTVYLLVAGGLALAHAGRLKSAAVIFAIAPMVHELAVLSALPVAAAVLVRNRAPKTTALVLAPAVAIAAVILLQPPTPIETIADIHRSLASAHFPIREGALDLFVRTQAESWELYSTWHGIEAVAPWTLTCMIATVLVQRDWSPIVVLASLAAIFTPLLLVYGGWDNNRWQLFTVTNFAIVMWASYDQLKPRAPVILAIALLVLMRLPILWLDVKSRPLSIDGITYLAGDLSSGTFFNIPTAY
ncbi:MAG: hypothetical protein QM831_26250 [Kofleriaceae bacterium]